MPKPSFLTEKLASIYKHYKDDAGKAMIQLGVAGWIFSALAQVVMLANNDKISNKDKKFLVPQEIADGVVNVGLYFAVSQGFKKYGDRLFEKGKVISKYTDKVIGKIKEDNQTIQNYVDGKVDDLFRINLIDKSGKKKKISTIYEALIKEVEGIQYKNRKPDIENCNFIKKEKIIINKKAKIELLDELKNAQSKFKKHKNAIGAVTTVVGSVIACNVLTPVCRNIIANQFQKKYINNKPKGYPPMPPRKAFEGFRV